MIPKELKSADGVALNPLWARRHGTKYNGAPYIVQAAGEAVYSEAGKKQTGEQIAYYMKNAKYIFDGLKNAGYSVSGGVNAPYIWLKTPDGMSSWEFFDYLLEKANVVGTPEPSRRLMTPHTARPAPRAMTRILRMSIA